MCTDLQARGHRECGWKPGGSFDVEEQDAGRQGDRSRRDTEHLTRLAFSWKALQLTPPQQARIPVPSGVGLGSPREPVSAVQLKAMSVSCQARIPCLCSKEAV